MLFQNYVQPQEYLYFMNLILGIINLIINILIVIYIINWLYVKKEIEDRKKERRLSFNLITWALFFLFIIIASIIVLIYRIFSGNGLLVLSEQEKLIEKIAILLIYSGFFTKILYLEYVINNLNIYKGYIFSIAFSVVMMFILFLDLESIKTFGPIQIIFFVLLAFSYSIIPILYLVLAIKTVGQSRKNALKVTVGTTLFALGSLAGPANLKGYFGISEGLDLLINSTLITGPIIVLIATIIIFDSFRKK